MKRGGFTGAIRYIYRSRCTASKISCCILLFLRSILMLTNAQVELKCCPQIGSSLLTVQIKTLPDIKLSPLPIYELFFAIIYAFELGVCFHQM